MSPEPQAPADVIDARVLALLGDSITTDHISPAGSISGASPAAAYLREHGVEPRDFNTYGARRGNHDVMVRGTFANIRLHNQLADGKEGGWTAHLPDGAVMTIFDASALVPAGGRPADRHRGPRVRLRVVARLGRERPAAPGCARRDRRVVRAHPPQQPGRHGHPAAAVPRRRERRERSTSTAPSCTRFAASRARRPARRCT